MLRDRTLICFASNYDFDPTSKHHVMNALSRTNDVLWVNWHGSRRPSLGRSDLGAIFEKLRQVQGGLRQARDRLWVLTPLVVPLPGSRSARQLNRQLLIQQIRAALRKLARRPRQLWSFAPDVDALAGAFGEELLVYYCVDEFAEFTGYDRATIRELDQRLCRRADLVLTTSQALFDSRQVYNPHTLLLRHGVEHDHFARTLDPQLPLAEELRAIPAPRIGYFGLVNDWLDYAMIAEVARRRPEWSWVFLGKIEENIAPYRQLPNLHFLGRRPYRELPSYCRGFDVASIPMKVNRLTRHVNPIKLREYLAAGLPVVTTPLPESLVFREGMFVASGVEETIKATEAALTRNSPEDRRRRSESVRSEGWASKVEVISAAVKNVQRERHAGLRRGVRIPA